MRKRGALSYDQDAAKPLDNNGFNEDGPKKLVNINFNNEATSYLYQ